MNPDEIPRPGKRGYPIGQTRLEIRASPSGHVEDRRVMYLAAPRQPARTGELPTRLFSDPGQPPIVVTCARSAARHLGDDPPRILLAGEESVDLTRAVALLGAQGMNHILCEGGPTLLDELVEADAVAEICVTLAPKLAGHQLVGSRRPARLLVPVGMRPEHALAYDDYVFLKYRR